jgi:hypothetical protein
MKHLLIFLLIGLVSFLLCYVIPNDFDWYIMEFEAALHSGRLSSKNEDKLIYTILLWIILNIGYYHRNKLFYILKTSNPMAESSKNVFISYAWGGESERIVNVLDAALQQRGLKIIRDKRNLGYKGSITSFMEDIGKGNKIIVVLSDRYLKSEKCMFELKEIEKNKDFAKRIFPIVLKDANIYDAKTRIDYIKFWEKETVELKAKADTVDRAYTGGIQTDIDKYSDIRRIIDQLTAIIADMNTLRPEMHEGDNFDTLYNSLL